MTLTSRYTLYVLISALAGAAGLLLTEILIRFYALAVIEITVPANVIGGLFLLLSAAVQGARGWRGWPHRDWLHLLIASAATFALGFLFLYGAVDLIGSSKTTLLGRLEVIFVVTLAVFFLGEKWTRHHWLAGGLALVGATIVNFNPDALALQFGTGEGLSLLSAITFAAGIVMLKSLVDRQDGRLVTGFGLLLGAVMLIPVALYNDVTGATILDAGMGAVLILLARGLLLGVSWVTYNVAMRHIGASRCSVLFLSIVFFTVVLQVVIATVAPGLGLRVPQNLGMALAGGACIGIAVFIIHRQQ